MYNWLDSIGRASRLYLKHIRLEFTDIFFLRYRDQCGKIWKKLISCHDLSAKVSIELSSGGADYVGTYNFRGRYYPCLDCLWARCLGQLAALGFNIVNLRTTLGSKSVTGRVSAALLQRFGDSTPTLLLTPSLATCQNLWQSARLPSIQKVKMWWSRAYLNPVKCPAYGA